MYVKVRVELMLRIFGRMANGGDDDQCAIRCNGDVDGRVAG